MNKLVRDGILEYCKRKGYRVLWRRLEGTEFQAALRHKFDEEIQEVLEAKPSNRINELADVLCVVSAYTQTGAEAAAELLNSYVTLCQKYRLSPNDVDVVRQSRADEVGEFAGRRFIVATEISPNDPWFDHFSIKYQRLSFEDVQIIESDASRR